MNHPSSSSSALATWSKAPPRVAGRRLQPPLRKARPSPLRAKVACWFLLGLLTWVGQPLVRAFPPTPHHLVYGMVRDEFGAPISSSFVQIILETMSGTRLSTTVNTQLGAGVNYELKVPMDAGLTRDFYPAKLLLTAAPFKMYVVLGGVTNVPIEMSGQYATLGRPGQKTVVHLTLGVDANRDGIPDAWEAAFLAALGSNLTLADLNANLDLAHNGRTLRQEYLLGADLLQPGDEFSARFVGFNGESAVLEFPTMTGRSYTVLGSSDLQHWSVASFRVAAEGSRGPIHTYYWAPDIQSVRVTIIPASGEAVARFYRVLLQ